MQQCAIHTTSFLGFFLGAEPPLNSQDPPLREEEDCVGTKRGLIGWGTFINNVPWSLQNGIFLFALKLSNWYFQGMDIWKFGALRVTFQEIGFDF